MAKLLKLDRTENESALAPLIELEPSTPMGPGPFWEWFKHDPAWQTDRWILRGEPQDHQDR